MSISLECPMCGSRDLDDGSFDYDGLNGILTHHPSPVYYNCMDCDWDGDEPENVGHYQAAMEDKAEGEREEKMMADWDYEELNFDEEEV